jgi:hypothetical protein
MFDEINQRKLLKMVSPETAKAILERIKSGGGSTDHLT